MTALLTTMNNPAAVQSACSRGIHPLLAQYTRGGTPEMDALLLQVTACVHPTTDEADPAFVPDFDEASRLIRAFVIEGLAPVGSVNFAAAVNADAAIQQMRDAAKAAR